jgi:hypothetical protein
VTRSTVLTASLAALAAALSFAAAQFSPQPVGGRPNADSPALAQPVGPHFAVVAARSAAKEKVTREFLAGRMTLPEAAARFARLNAAPPRAVAQPSDDLARQAGLPDAGDVTEAERAALQVITWAEVVARRESPSRAREVTEGLRRQFLGDRAAGRLARLPAVPDAKVDELLGPAGDRVVNVEATE